MMCGKRAWFGVAIALALSACGDDSEPVQDTSDTTDTRDTSGDSAADTTAPADTTVDTADTAPADTVVPDTQNDSGDTRPEDTEPADTTPADTADTTPADTEPADTADTAPADTTPADTGPSFVTWDDVYPIFRASCSPCHAGATVSSGSGGHSIASPDQAIAYDASQLSADLAKCAGKTIGECALVRIRDGSMPATGDCQEPIGAKCPDLDEQALIEQWIADGMRE